MLKRILLAVALVLTATSLPAAEAPRVRVSTSMGAFVIQLDAERAPLTVDSFLRYARSGQYDGTLFHRVIGRFMIQGGGMDANYKARQTKPPVPNESGNGLRNLRGTVGLARTAAPHSGDCQFFVNVVDNGDLDPLPTRWGYAVFGRVTEGMDVVDRISGVATGAVGPLPSDAPLKPVVIEKVEVLGADSAASAAPDTARPLPPPIESPSQ